MNTKSLVLAGAIGLGAISMAQAASVVYMTGSTAGRKAVYTTLVDNNTVFDSTPTVVFQGSGSTSAAGTADGASYINYSGNVGGVATVLKCAWSGSEGGIADIAGSGTENFLDDTAVTYTDGTKPGPFVSASVQLAAADNDKAYSKNPSAAITGTKVGIIPFKWLAQKGSAAALTGVTDSALRVALGGGTKLALFTGNSADTTRVYVSGRDDNSGTRVNALGNTGFGIFSSVSQLQVNANGSMTDQGGGTYLGNYGYSGGGDLATQLGVSLDQSVNPNAKDVSPFGDGSSPYSVVAYAGISDANSAVGKGATVLTYNGVPFSIAAIKEGQYTFWGNYYIYKKNSGLSTEAGTIYNKLTGATGVKSHADDTVLIKTTSMHATRTSPVADPTHN